MGDCIILGNAAVYEILSGLSREEIQMFIQELGTCLKNFSVTDERKYQPDPSVVNRAEGRKNLFRMFTSTTGVGVKIIVDPSKALADEQVSYSSEAERNQMMGLHGVLALCDQNGFANGFINAEGLTAFRTSICALLLYVKRKETANIVVFGAGKQALWHTRLALALRGSEIKRVTFVNRSAERTKSLLEQIKKDNDAQWKVPVEFDMITTSDQNHQSQLEQVLGQADVVFCTTPSKEILFPANYLTARKGGCYISAIGSWQPDMIELDPELLEAAVQRDGGMGLIIGDDRPEVMHATGEGKQSKLEEKQIMEVGEALDRVEKDEKLRSFLENGFVIYKSVGVSMTDLATGQALLRIARERKMGISVADF